MWYEFEFDVDRICYWGEAKITGPKNDPSLMKVTVTYKNKPITDAKILSIARDRFLDRFYEKAVNVYMWYDDSPDEFDVL
jgi:hypothetical protein